MVHCEARGFFAAGFAVSGDRRIPYHPSLIHHRGAAVTCAYAPSVGGARGTSTTPPLHRPCNLTPTRIDCASRALERASTSPEHTRPHNLALKRFPASVVQDSTSSPRWLADRPWRPSLHRCATRPIPSLTFIGLQFATPHSCPTLLRHRCRTTRPASVAGIRSLRHRRTRTTSAPLPGRLHIPTLRHRPMPVAPVTSVENVRP
jgi:hypothetical protein